MRLPWSKVKEAEKETPDSSIVDNGVTTPKADDNHATEKASENAAAATEVNALDISNNQNNDDSQLATDEKPGVLERTASTATASSAGDGEDTTKYKSGLKLYLLTFGLAMSTFVVALDNTIIATAIPRITTVFDSLNDVGWYGSSYLLTTTSLQPSFGKIYTYFNIKYTYISALVIFEIGSVICGAAVNSEMLIVGRAIAGMGAAALFSGGMIIVGYTVPLHRRPIYIGLLSSMFGKSSICVDDTSANTAQVSALSLDHF